MRLVAQELVDDVDPAFPRKLEKFNLVFVGFRSDLFPLRSQRKAGY